MSCGQDDDDDFYIRQVSEGRGERVLIKIYDDIDRNVDNVGNSSDGRMRMMYIHGKCPKNSQVNCAAPFPPVPLPSFCIVHNSSLRVDDGVSEDVEHAHIYGPETGARNGHEHVVLPATVPLTSGSPTGKLHAGEDEEDVHI